jgi:hypothetical protein
MFVRGVGSAAAAAAAGRLVRGCTTCAGSPMLVRAVPDPGLSMFLGRPTFLCAAAAAAAAPAGPPWSARLGFRGGAEPPEA